MDTAKFQSDVLPTLVECSRLLVTAAGHLGSKNAVVLIESEGLYTDLLYAFNKVIRKFPPGEGIDLILHSHGGTVDTASSIASLCRERFGSFRVVVPFMAKSAATLLVLSANERLLSCSAQLGPVDPQVRHPEKRNVWFPAHSIKEALERVEATKDPIVKASMAEKLDPFLIGSYQDAISACKQYIEEVVQTWQGVSDREAAVSAFLDKYKSHGYPIDRTVLKAIGAPFSPLTVDTEQVVGDLHEKCVDILEGEEDGLIIVTKEEYFFRIGEDFTEHGKFSAVPPLPVPSAS